MQIFRQFSPALTLAVGLLYSVTVEDMLAQTPAQGTRWVGTWASAQMLVEGPDLGPDDLRDATLRQVVHISTGGSRVSEYIFQTRLAPPHCRFDNQIISMPWSIWTRQPQTRLIPAV